MHSQALRIIFGVTLVWSLLQGFDLHQVVKVAMQVAHIEHHLVDHDESVIDVFRCLAHDDSSHEPTSDSEHHRHHDQPATSHCGSGCMAHFAVPVSIAILTPNSSTKCRLSVRALVNGYTENPFASIFQPPRA